MNRIHRPDRRTSVRLGQLTGSVSDTPVLAAVGAAAPAFSLAWSPALKGSASTLSVSNRRITSTSTNWASVRVSSGKSTGKWHAEATIRALSTTGVLNIGGMFGVASSALNLESYMYQESQSTCTYPNGTECKYVHNNSGVWDFIPGTTPTPPVGTVLLITVDFDAKKVWVGKNGTYYNSANPTTGNGAFTWAGTRTLYVAASVYGLCSLELTSPVYTPSGFSVW